MNSSGCIYSWTDDKNKIVIEFFSDNFFPHVEKGGHIEPGHAFEWVWLLKKHAELTGNTAQHDAICLRLLDKANVDGWDKEYGGIYDTVSPNGHVIANTKRIWPFCEALKANALMLTHAPDRQAIKDRTRAMVDVFEEQYMQERGFWTEWLSRDLKPAADYMPGTTPYHVYFGIMETWQVIEGRGESVSMIAALEEKLYGWRRSVSDRIKTIRG